MIINPQKLIALFLTITMLTVMTAPPAQAAYIAGLATEWKPSNEMKTWTFKLRSGVKFHEGWGDFTADDLKFTVEQSFKPDALGGSAYFFRNHLDRIETPDKLTV